MRPDTVMIFAAGFGTRMGGLVEAVPKPLLQVAGRTLLDRTIDLAASAGVSRHVVNAHYLADKIVEHLAGRDIAVRVERPDILDTGGGLKAALPELRAETVFTANSDMIWGGPNPYASLPALDDDTDACLLVVPSERAIGRKGPGDFTLGADGRINRGGAYVYTGLQIIRTGRVAEMADRVFSLNDVWDRLIAEDRLRAVEYPGHWVDVGRPEGLALAETVLAEAGDA